MGIGGLSLAELSPVFFLLMFLYALPTFIAWRRKHNSLGSVAIVNILTGWSLIGWVAALIWSFLDNDTKA